MLLGESHLRTAVREYLAHYHEERNRQGLASQLILPPANLNQPGPGGRTWTEIKVKEPFTTASKTWAEEILPKAQKMVEAGREHGVSDLRFSFPRGVDASVKAALESMGFKVEGP